MVDDLKVERLDHLGIISGVIKELGLIEMIDQRIPSEDREEISTGEAVAGMILNGLGFSDRPLSLTPQFFTNKPLEVLFRPGVCASHFNHFKLGRSLDKVFAYGCDLLFSELALSVCEQQGIDQRFTHLDTTTFSLSGDYVPEAEDSAILITHGYSKDHRPDLKQAVLELVVAQDGGVPLVSQSWDGNTADTTIFKARTEALVEQFKQGPSPRFLLADSKLYTQANAPHLAALPFITRLPETLKVVGQVIDQAWSREDWPASPKQTAIQRIDLCHYGIEQRWLVVYSPEAWQRAEATLRKAREKEYTQIEKQLFHLQAQRFTTPQQAQQALDAVAQTWTYHRVQASPLTAHTKYAQPGRPTPNTPIEKTRWQIHAQVEPDTEKIQKKQQHKACFVLASNIADTQLSDTEVLAGYKGQQQVEGGFRFLKDPLFFTAALFIKKPSRIQGLLMVMTLALLIYSVAQRRLRQHLAQQQETLPNQIGQPTATPTLRWVFQLLEGINLVSLTLQAQARVVIEGLTDLRKKILQLFGQKVCQIYQISLA